MKAGEYLGPYRLVSQGSTAGGGKSISARAERDGRSYFVKRHLNPVYPSDDAEMEEATRLRRMKICQQFEASHQEIADRVRARAVGGGNIVAEEDFFRHGSHYYSVTDWIDDMGWSAIPSLTDSQILILMRTMLSSVKVLHDHGVVHGDLKPDNLLVLQNPASPDFFLMKVIDLDSAYVETKPPSARRIGGDERYMAPELLDYHRGAHDDGTQLTTRADVFTLGLLLHEIRVGQPPSYEVERFDSCGAAVSGGSRLVVAPDLSPVLQLMIGEMTRRDPKKRPTVQSVLELMLAIDESAVRRSPEPPVGLRINMGR